MKGKILIVDDSAEIRRLLATMLTQHTEYEICLASDGQSVLRGIERDLPDVILLDIMMPNMSGYEVSQALKNNPRTRDIPIIFLTALADLEDKVKAFQAGGVDYINKPFHELELLARVDAHLHLKKMRDNLNELVEEKTLKLERTTIALVNALENANLYNDDDTGNHIKRVNLYSEVLAKQSGCDADFIKRIKLYASLHDVGKVGIPDHILKKQGKYTPEEFLMMQEHVVIGARMLDSPEIDTMAKNVALYHHEKWSGGGYVKKLSGENIPLEARIVAIADVYDALTSKRSYKEAFPEERACQIIREESGRHFDPTLIDVFFRDYELIHKIKSQYNK